MFDCVARKLIKRDIVIKINGTKLRSENKDILKQNNDKFVTRGRERERERKGKFHDTNIL